MSDDVKKSTSAVRFECATPILNVSSMQESLAYYVEKLGFRIAWQWGDPVGFACVARDGVELYMCEGAQGNGAVWLSVFVNDVDALHEEYLQSGVHIVQPPTNFPWGVREMNIEDPDGHRLRMGSESTAEPDGVNLAE